MVEPLYHWDDEVYPLLLRHLLKTIQQRHQYFIRYIKSTTI